MGAIRTWAPFWVVVVALLSLGADSEGANPAALLREFGFPIFVSVWFMWRVEKRMDRFTDTVQSLLLTVTVMAKTIDDLSSNKRPPTEPPTA
jgi:hypothetical protein